MRDKPILRTARLSDIADMSRCAALAYAEVVATLEGLPDVTKITADDLLQAVAHVAEVEGKLAGFLIAYERDESMKLVNLAVDPGYQGNGVARLLLDNIENMSRSSGKKRMELVSHIKMMATLEMYQYLGWKEDGRQGVAIFMSKRL